ncbi:MAG: PAS domain S-box protein [bacterium]|nr:PAS domain S-box protein [bacterium]
MTTESKRDEAFVAPEIEAETSQRPTIPVDQTSGASARDFAAQAEDLRRLNQRLVCLFRGVPDLVAAPSVPEKMLHAATILTGNDLYRGCEIVLEDPEQGILRVAKGDGYSLESADIAKRYTELKQRIADGKEQIESLDPAADGVSWILTLPVLSPDRRLMGVLCLQHDDATLNRSGLIEMVSVFLAEMVQAIEQFRMERELERNEARYRGIIDNVGDVIFQTDRDGRLTFVSRQVHQMLGRAWRDLLGVSILDHVSPADYERAANAMCEVLGGKAVRLDCNLMRPDGSEITLFVSANPIVENGTIIGGLGIARDVTEKRRLEEQIRDSERRYRALTENAYDAILLVEPETCIIVDANPQTEQLTGYSRAELLKMSLMDLRRPDQAGEVRQRIEEVMCAGVGRFEDTPLIRKSGEEVFVDTAASVYEVEGRRYYQAIVRDVTVQRDMNEALQKRVLEMQILAEVSDALQSAADLPSVMGIVLAGVTAGKGLGFNRGFILSYDKSNHELRGEAGLGPASAEEAGRIWSELAAKSMSLSDIFAEQLHRSSLESDAAFEYARRFVVSLDDEDNVFARVVRNREALCVDMRVENPHLPEDFLGLYRAKTFAVVPLVTRDDVMGVLLVDNLFTRHDIRDEDLHRLKLFANSAASAIERGRLLVSLERRLHELTLTNQDLKASRDRLIQTERLSAIGEVAANVAHEIRNPLTAVGGFARSVYASLSEGDKNRRKIEIILEETDRLEEMLSSLLEFTRPAVPRFTELDLNGFLMQTLHFMDGEIEANHVRVVFELDPDLPRVWADNQQMRQVVLNIVRNALQEMKQGGILTITTTGRKEDVLMAFRDTGPGIAPEGMDKIFEAFYTTKASGSGLGLSVCAQIVRNHNGRIEISSLPGEGAQFTISLPAAGRLLDSY